MYIHIYIDTISLIKRSRVLHIFSSNRITAQRKN